jgi:hypothetical protein
MRISDNGGEGDDSYRPATQTSSNNIMSYLKTQSTVVESVDSSTGEIVKSTVGVEIDANAISTPKVEVKSPRLKAMLATIKGQH